MVGADGRRVVLGRHLDRLARVVDRFHRLLALGEPLHRHAIHLLVPPVQRGF